MKSSHRSLVRVIALGVIAIVVPFASCNAVVKDQASSRDTEESEDAKGTEATETFEQQIKRLDLKNLTEVRLNAVKWMRQFSKAKGADLALPVLERSIREDPSSLVRQVAVQALGTIAMDRKDPCPAAIIEAMLDKSTEVSETAGFYTGAFERVPPDAVPILLRCMKSERVSIRSEAVGLLARAAPKDEQARAAIEQATRDKSFRVRHNAEVAYFKIANDLPRFLSCFARASDDLSLFVDDESNKEEAKLEQATRELARIGGVMLVAKWSDERPAELASALVGLLADKSWPVRAGAARMIGTAYIKIDAAELESPRETAEKPTKPPQPPQRSKAADYFDKLKVEDRLRNLRDNDPTASVQAVATLILARIATVREKSD